MVPRERLELSSSCEGQLLRLECLPISPPRQAAHVWRIASLDPVVLDAVCLDTAYSAPRIRLALHPNVGSLVLP